MTLDYAAAMHNHLMLASLLLQAFDKGERLLDLLVGGLQLLAIGAGPDQQEDHRSQRGHLADVAQIKRGKAYDDD